MCPSRVARCAVWGVPSPPLPVRGFTPPPSPSPAGRARGAHVDYQGVPPPPLSPGCTLGYPAAWSGFPPPSPGYVREARCCVGGSPPSPPWWLHVLSMCCCSGCPHFSSLSSGWPPMRGAHYLFRSHVPISLLLVPPVLVVSSGIFSLPWGPAAARSPVGSYGASKPYLHRTSAPCSGLAPSSLLE